MISRLFGGIWSYVAGFFAIMAALGTIYAKGRSDARAKAEHEANLEKIKAMKAKKDIDDEVSKLSGTDLDKRASRWLRND
jgi:hypothetical protein